MQQRRQPQQPQRALVAYASPPSSSSAHYLPPSYHCQYPPSPPQHSASLPDRFPHPAAYEAQELEAADEQSVAFDAAFDFLPEPQQYQHAQQQQSQHHYPPLAHSHAPHAAPHRAQAALCIDSPPLMLDSGVDEDEMRLVMPTHADRLYDSGLMTDESYAASEPFSPSFSTAAEPFEYELPGLSQHELHHLPQHHQQQHRQPQHQHQHQHQQAYSDMDRHYRTLDSDEQPLSPHQQPLLARRPVLATPALEIHHAPVAPVVPLGPVPPVVAVPRHHSRQQQPHHVSTDPAAIPASTLHLQSSWREAAAASGPPLRHPQPQPPHLVRRTSLPSSASLSALPVLAPASHTQQPQTASPPRIARPYTLSPYATPSSSSSSPRFGSQSSATSVAGSSNASRSPSGSSCVASPRSRSGGSVSQPASPEFRAQTPPSLPTSSRSASLLSSALVLPHAVVTPAKTLTRTPSASAATAAATVTPAISLHSLPPTPRASSAVSPSAAAVAATTLRSAPVISAVMPATYQARPCPVSSSPTASRSSRRAQAAVPATVVTQVPALALTIQPSEQTEAPASAGGKKRRRRAGSQQMPAGYRGSATDTHAASQQKRFTYEPVVASPLQSTPARVAEAATVLPTSPVASAPFARRRFSTVSTTSSSISATSEDSGASPASCYLPSLSTEDIVRMQAPNGSGGTKALRSHSICSMEATQAVDLTPKRRRSCATYSPSSSPPAPPHVVTVPLPSLTRLVKLADQLSRAMVVRGVEHLFSTDHEKQAEGNVPSPSQVSTGSEGSGGSDAASMAGMGWEERVAGRVRDYLRVRFPTPEARAVVESVLPHVLFIHERGWQDYADCWEKEGGAGGVVVKALGEFGSMQRVSSDIAGTISALTLE